MPHALRAPVQTLPAIIPPTITEEPDAPETLAMESSRRHKANNHSRQLYMTWLPIFTWAKPIVEGDEISRVICNVCSKITWKSKPLQPDLIICRSTMAERQPWFLATKSQWDKITWALIMFTWNVNVYVLQYQPIQCIAQVLENTVCDCWRIMSILQQDTLQLIMSKCTIFKRFSKWKHPPTIGVTTMGGEWQRQLCVLSLNGLRRSCILCTSSHFLVISHIRWLSMLEFDSRWSLVRSVFQFY